MALIVRVGMAGKNDILQQIAGLIAGIWSLVIRFALKCQRILRRVYSLARSSLQATWKQRFILNVPARWRGLRWLDRWVFKPLGLGPRLLSNTVKFQSDDARSARRRDQSLYQRVRDWIWLNHSVPTAILGSFLLTFIVIVVCLLLGWWLFPDEPVGPSAGGGVSTLLTIAEVTGSVAGILLAVITFSVELRARNEEESALIPLVARRYGMFLIGGVVVAIAATNGVMPVVGPRIYHGSVECLLLLDILLVPISFLLSLWLVSAVIQDSGSSTFENTLPVIKVVMAEIALRQGKGDRLIAAYERLLNPLGLEYSPIGWYTSPWSSETSSQYMIRKRGKIVDVDLVALAQLGDVVASIEPRVTAQMTLRPGDDLTDEAGLVLKNYDESKTEERISLGGATEGRDDSDDVERRIDDATRRSIERWLRRTFILRTKGLFDAS